MVESTRVFQLAEYLSYVVCYVMYMYVHLFSSSRAKTPSDKMEHKQPPPPQFARILNPRKNGELRTGQPYQRMLLILNIMYIYYIGHTTLTNLSF